MSITAYTGLPGSGKSYGVVLNVIIPALKSGRTVVTNIPLKEQEILQFAGSGKLLFIPQTATAEDIVNLVPAGAVAVIDEIWRYWSAGDTASKIPETQKAFFATHRHNVGEGGFSTEIVLVTQDLSQTSAFLRALVEQTFRSVKLTKIGSTKNFRIDCYDGAVTGQNPPVARLTRQIFGKYKPEVYNLYTSHTMSTTGAAGIEQKADKRGNVLYSFKLGAAALALLLLPFLLYRSWRTFHPVAAAVDPVKQNSDDATKKESSGSQPTITVHAVGESKTWRLVGRIIINEVVYFLIDSQGGSRKVPLKSCDRDEDLLNWRCHVDGEIVAAWTGPAPAALTQFVASSVTPQ